MQNHPVSPQRVLFPIGLGTALSLMGDATLYTVLPTHAESVGITFTQVGIMLGVNRAIRLLSNGPAGMAYDRFPRRWIFIPALFLGAVSTLVYALSHSFWLLFMGRLMWGIAWSGIWVGGTTMILDVSSESDRGKWTGLYQVWFFFGSATGAVVGGAFTDLLGYYGAMWIGALLTGAGALVTLLFLPETRPDLREFASRILANPRKILRSGAKSWFHYGRQKIPFTSSADKTRFYFVVGLRGINRFIIAGILSATLGLIVRDHLHIDSVLLGVASLTGILMAGRTLLSMLGAILSGLGSDYFHNRWITLSLGLLIGVGSMLLLSGERNYILILGVLFAAMGRGSIQSMTTSLTGDLTPRLSRGKAVGLLHTIGDLGSAVGPSFAYFLIPRWGLSSVYVLCAAIFGLSLIANIVLMVMYKQ
jgi:MFS family permease